MATLVGLWTDVLRVVVNVGANVLVCGVLEGWVLPKYSHEKNTWLSMLEGLLGVVMQQLLVPGLADLLMPFSQYSSFDRVSQIALGFYLMPESVHKLNGFGKKLRDQRK